MTGLTHTYYYSIAANLQHTYTQITPAFRTKFNHIVFFLSPLCLPDAKCMKARVTDTAMYHHHHHLVQLARISLTLSRHLSLSFIASGWSSHSCCMYVRAGRPAFARPYVGVHMSTSLMSSPLLLQQCPACPVSLIWTVFVMGDRWPYSWCLVG